MLKDIIDLDRLMNLLDFENYVDLKEAQYEMSNSAELDCLTVGIAQIAPVWLNRERTLDKIEDYWYLKTRYSPYFSCGQV